jgi:hypothetical protein
MYMVYYNIIINMISYIKQNYIDSLIVIAYIYKISNTYTTFISSLYKIYFMLYYNKKILRRFLNVK